VKLLRRRPAAEPAPDTQAQAEPAAVDGAPSSGKGRPTPKRRDVVGQRGPVRAPQTRKEAYARQKQLAKEARTAQRTSTGGRLTPQQRRALLRAGDPSVLPRRDQGPTRRLARDYVDSHRMASNYLLLLFPLMIASYAVRSPILQLVVLAAFIAFLLEWYLTGRRIRRLAIERFGKADGGAMGLGLYAGSRAYLPRKWRLPAPQVSPGDEI
jgi:hypothetical protein